MSEAEILADFPDLTSDDIRACGVRGGSRAAALVRPCRVKAADDAAG
jgi:hypothetical protein